jgi:predicted metal-dependent peptidase
MIKRLLQKITTEEPGFGQVLAQTLKEKDTSLPHVAAIRYREGVYTLVYNPDDLFAYSEPDQITILLHEVLHIVNFHHCRWRNRDPFLWNLATDCAVNSLLLHRMSDELQKELILPVLWDLPGGKSAEWYYTKLQKKDTDSVAPNHAHWYTAQADPQGVHQLRERAGLEDKSGSPVDWKSILMGKLRSYCSAKKSYSAKRFSRRYGKPPGKRRRRLPCPIVIVVDTSPSVSSVDLARFFNQVRAIKKQLKTQVTVIECSDSIKKEYLFEGDEEAPVREGSQTVCTPALARAQEINSKTRIGALLYFSDGDIHEKEIKKPTFPVIWVYPRSGCRKVVQWGDHVCLSIPSI